MREWVLVVAMLAYSGWNAWGQEAKELIIVGPQVMTSSTAYYFPSDDGEHLSVTDETVVGVGIKIPAIRVVDFKVKVGKVKGGEITFTLMDNGVPTTSTCTIVGDKQNKCRDTMHHPKLIEGIIGVKVVCTGICGMSAFNTAFVEVR